MVMMYKHRHAVRSWKLVFLLLELFFELKKTQELVFSQS
jgi:hypothetical protein